MSESALEKRLKLAPPPAAPREARSDAAFGDVERKLGLAFAR